MRFWPFGKLETRETTDYSDAVITQILANAGQNAAGNASAVAALEACTGLWGRGFASADVSPSNLRTEALTPSVLETVGQEIYVDDEKYLDMATALSGSGPAYVFLIIEALIDAGVYVGLPRDVARAAALQTLYGSTKLVMQTGKQPAELKAMVVSPGGTTAEGLQVLERAGVPAAIVEAVYAAYQKSIKLGQQ